MNLKSIAASYVGSPEVYLAEAVQVREIGGEPFPGDALAVDGVTFRNREKMVRNGLR